MTAQYTTPAAECPDVRLRRSTEEEVCRYVGTHICTVHTLQAHVCVLQQHSGMSPAGKTLIGLEMASDSLV